MANRYLTSWIPALTLLAGSAAAQAPNPLPIPVPAPGAATDEDGYQDTRPPLEARRYRGSYSESVSRELFGACDGNSDDRLDVLEAVEAFDLLPSPRDHQGYARFDPDRDGFVTWPEFDQRFRRSLETTGTFRIRTRRAFSMPDAPPQKASALQKFLRAFDADGDGELSPVEVQKMLAATGLPAALAAPLMAADIDASGSISEAELAPWFQTLPLDQLPQVGESSSLPRPWFDGDADKDGAIDLDELRAVLRTLDPGLLRWAPELFAKLDADGDGALGIVELQPSTPAAGAGEQPSPAAPESGPDR
jgi:Ca2+-binding EF-hand superfamily protein